MSVYEWNVYFEMGPKNFTVLADISINAFVDGKPTTPPALVPSIVEFDMDSKMNHRFKINFGIALCAGNTSHFDSMWYDPTFGLIFGAEDPTLPLTPQQKKVQNSQRIIIAVTVSVVLIIVILAISVPVVALFFRPYLARRRAGKADGSNIDNAGVSSPPHSSSNGWTRSAKPSD